ncbi:hypothetical protein [Halorubrum sp. AS12]|uniref:hypothetical protein n=1 Tax=Halorubrum sp. AS12 TaxID=3409687 RepID=UPI003DA749B4
MSLVSELSRTAHHPKLLARKANRAYYTQFRRREYNNKGIDIFEEDWDNLILLDACRFNLLKNNKDIITGKLESRISRGSSTVEFLRGNFKNKKLLDTVYVNSNPQLHRHRDEINSKIFHVENVWENNWDSEKKTVLPTTVTNEAMKLSKEFPEKRFIVHYIQPHYPFIGDKPSDFDNSQAFLKPGEAGSWTQIYLGEISVDTHSVYKSYEQNLRICLNQVKDLLDELVGKTVITSDHGNMLGERSSPIPVREWGHPTGIYTPELVNVPWLVPPFDKRKKVTTSQLVSESNPNKASSVNSRLQDLGYLE